MKVENKTRFYIHVAIIFAFMFGFGFLPPLDPITAKGMRILGILFGCIWGWTCGWQIWPSLLALVTLGFVEGYTVTSVFTSGFGNQTLLIVLMCLVFCGIVEKTGFLNVMADAILRMKIAQKGPFWLMFVIFFASCACSMVCNNIAVTFFMWTIVGNICKQLGLKKGDVYASMLFIGVVCLSYLGGTLKPYGAFIQIGLALMNSLQPGFQLNYLAYMGSVLIICFCMVPASTLLFKAICPKFEYHPVDIASGEKKKVTTLQIVGLVFTLVITAILVFGSFFPKESIIYFVTNNLGVIGVMAFGAVVMSVLIIDGETVAELGNVFKNVPWDMILLLTAALTISSAVTGAGTGVSDALKAVTSPILGDKSPIIFLAILIFAGVVLTNCLNNIVTYTLLLPISLIYAGTYGIPAGVLVTVFAIILLQGIVLPSGSVMGAALHGQKEWVETKHIYIYSSIIELLLAAVVAIIAAPIMLMMF